MAIGALAHHWQFDTNPVDDIINPGSRQFTNTTEITPVFRPTAVPEGFPTITGGVVLNIFDDEPDVGAGLYQTQQRSFGVGSPLAKTYSFVFSFDPRESGNAFAGHNLLSVRDDGNLFQVILQNDGTIQVYINEDFVESEAYNNRTTSLRVARDGVPHSLIITKPGSGYASVYWDGVAQSMSNIAGFSNTPDTLLVLGARGSGSEKGEFTYYDLRMYDGDATAEEALALYEELSGTGVEPRRVFDIPGFHNTDPNPKRNDTYDVDDRVDVNQTPLDPVAPKPHKPVVFKGDDPYHSMPSQPFLRNI